MNNQGYLHIQACKLTRPLIRGHCNRKVVFQPLFFVFVFSGIHLFTIINSRYLIVIHQPSDVCFENFDSQKHILSCMGLNVGTFFSQSTVPSFFSPCFMDYPTFHAPSTAPFAAKLQHAPQRACCCTWVERVFSSTNIPPKDEV